MITIKKGTTHLIVTLLILALIMTMAIASNTGNIYASEESARTVKEVVEVSDEDLLAIEEYCNEFDIEMSNDPEFISEVLSMIDYRNIEIIEKSDDSVILRSSSSSGGSNPLKQSKYIPTSAYSDIIWTNCKQSSKMYIFSPTSVQ